MRTNNISVRECIGQVEEERFIAGFFNIRNGFLLDQRGRINGIVLFIDGEIYFGMIVPQIQRIIIMGRTDNCNRRSGQTLFYSGRRCSD